MPERFTQDVDRVRRFEREARAASATSHPNIITVYEIGRTGNCYFIATEYVDGETLQQRMLRGPMKLREVLEVAIQVVSALSAAHEAGIVHRDVKPENIMVRRDGIVKVLDFGLAKLTELVGPERGSVDAGQELLRTDPGKVMGTPRYMSPEQVTGHEVDTRSDLFSFGVVLYQMVAGRPPFEGAVVNELMAEILNHDPPAAPALFAGVARRTRADREQGAGERSRGALPGRQGPAD